MWVRIGGDEQFGKEVVSKKMGKVKEVSMLEESDEV